PAAKPLTVHVLPARPAAPIVICCPTRNPSANQSPLCSVKWFSQMSYTAPFESAACVGGPSASSWPTAKPSGRKLPLLFEPARLSGLTVSDAPFRTGSAERPTGETVIVAVPPPETTLNVPPASPVMSMVAFAAKSVADQVPDVRVIVKADRVWTVTAAPAFVGEPAIGV